MDDLGGSQPVDAGDEIHVAGGCGIVTECQEFTHWESADVDLDQVLVAHDPGGVVGGCGGVVVAHGSIMRRRLIDVNTQRRKFFRAVSQPCHFPTWDDAKPVRRGPPSQGGGTVATVRLRRQQLGEGLDRYQATPAELDGPNRARIEQSTHRRSTDADHRCSVFRSDGESWMFLSCHAWRACRTYRQASTNPRTYRGSYSSPTTSRASLDAQAA